MDVLVVGEVNKWPLMVLQLASRDNVDMTHCANVPLSHNKNLFCKWGHPYPMTFLSTIHMTITIINTINHPFHPNHHHRHHHQPAGWPFADTITQQQWSPVSAPVVSVTRDNSHCLLWWTNVCHCLFLQGRHTRASVCGEQRIGKSPGSSIVLSERLHAAHVFQVACFSFHLRHLPGMPVANSVHHLLPL